MAYTIEGSVIPEHRREPAHYYGSIVRVLFAVGAVILFIAATTVPLPLPLFGTVINAIILIIAAGITNPEQDGYSGETPHSPFLKHSAERSLTIRYENKRARFAGKLKACHTYRYGHT